MMLELNDVLAIISKNNSVMMGVIDKWSAENPDEEGALNELRNIINVYTGNISRAITYAENERVCSTLEGMEKYEFKTDGEGEE